MTPVSFCSAMRSLLFSAVAIFALCFALNMLAGLLDGCHNPIKLDSQQSTSVSG